MSILTLSPEEHAYAIALVALTSTSAATLAGLIHTRRRAASASFLPTYAATLAIVAALALILTGVPTLESHSLGGLGLALLAAGIACLAALRGEAHIARLLRRRSRRGAARRVSITTELVRPDLASRPAATGSSVLSWLLVIAAGEEVLFRGVLVDLARQVPGGSTTHAVLLVASVIAFAFSHSQLGFAEALSKLPLSVACMAACLVSGTVLAPIAAHVAYNAWMWRAATEPRPTRTRAADASTVDSGEE